MKRKLVMLGLLGFATLFGCSQSEGEKVSASLPEGFEIITEDEIGERSEQYVIKHVETGCHYLLVEQWEANAVTQMFIEKNGTTIPYCKEGELSE